MANESSFTFLLEDSFSDNDKSMTEDCSSKLKISFRILISLFKYLQKCKCNLFPYYFFLINDHDALESLVQKYDGELLQRTLEQSLSSCSDNLLDEKIFNEIFPLAHDLLSKVKK